MSKTKRNWTPKEKLEIVLEGLKEKVSLGELCARHGINQTQYYRWRDKLFEEGDKVFEHGGISKAEERLKNENKRLKGVIGELTLELKKNDY